MIRLIISVAPRAREDSPRPNPILGILTPSLRVMVGVDILYLIVDRDLREEDNLSRLFSLKGKRIYIYIIYKTEGMWNMKYESYVRDSTGLSNVKRPEAG